MWRLLSIVSVLVVIIFLYSMNIREKEGFSETEIAGLRRQMSELDATESTIRDRRYFDRLNIRKKRVELMQLKNTLSESYAKDVCDKVPQFEEMNPSDLSKASLQDGKLSFKKTYHKGTWDEEDSECVSPFPKKQICSDYTVNCASEGTNNLVHRIGVDNGDSCEFDSCPIYCLSYNEDCSELRTRAGEHTFHPITGVRSNCVNPLDDNMAECIEAVPENCPQKPYYYYDDNNITIRSNLSTRSVDASKTCRYERSVTDRPTFNTMEQAMSNCSGMSAFKECYSPNGPGRFLHSTHRLDRSGCFYPGDPGTCKSFSELTCPSSPPYYTVRGSVFDSQAGEFYKSYDSSTVPQSLSRDSSGYVCVHTQPSGTMSPSELYNTCESSCFSGDGSEPATTKSGSINSDRSTCVVPDCYAASQKIHPSDCPEQSYYYYDTDNLTVLSGNKTKDVVQNACVYSIPTDASLPTFDNEDAARDSCGGMYGTKVCYYEQSNGDVLSETHSLDRNTCAYIQERSNCMDTVSTGSSCPGTTTYYKTDSNVTYEGSGRARKTVLSENVSNQLTASSPTEFVCSQSPPSPGYSLQPECTMECYTPTSGTARVNVSGVLEGDQCVVFSDCHQTRRLSECSDTTTYYKLGTGEFDGSGRYNYPIETEVLTYTLDNNVCEQTPASTGFGSLPTECNKECYSALGGPSRLVSGTVTPSGCTIEDCYDTEQLTECSEGTTYYTLDAGSFDGSGNFQKNVESVRIPHTVQDNECVIQSAPTGYGPLPTDCSKVCYPGDGGDPREVTGIATSSNCIMSDCFETRHQSSEAPIISGYTFDDGSECVDSGTGTIYRANDGEFLSDDTYMFTQDKKEVPYTQNENGECSLLSANPGYGESPVDCTAVCYDGTESISKSGSWDSTDTTCTVPDCKACGAENNQVDVYKHTFNRYDMWNQKAIFDVDTQSVPTALNSSNICEIGELPAGYTLSNQCTYDNCHRVEEDPSTRYTKTGVMIGSDKCEVRGCFTGEQIYWED